MAYSLIYELNPDGTSYSVRGYSDITTSDNVVIPDKFDGGINGEYPVTSIGEDAFSGCNDLTSITIGNNVTSIGDHAFYECSSLTSITIPFVGATKDGTSNTHFGYIFGASASSDNSSYVPSSLKTVVITGGTSIGGSAFHDCSSLTNITIPDSVTSIGNSAFYSCSSLTSVTIPDSVTSIDDFAFGICSSLTSITIPNSVTSIGIFVFEKCTNLKQLILFPSKPPTLGSNVIPTTTTIYVQQSSKEAYKTATNWKSFAEKIVADDMRLYFTMNARATKKWFKSKIYLDNDGYLHIDTE